MANFKVGQRVRIIASDSRLCGREGVITEVRESCRVWSGDKVLGIFDRVFLLDVDGIGPRWPDAGRPIGYLASDLAPLTDPKADEFIENIKKLGPLSEPLRELIVVTDDATYAIKGTEVKRISL